MKKFSIILASFFTLQSLHAQVREGIITYDKRTDMHRGVPDQYKPMIPQFQDEQHQLLFSSSATLFRQMPKEEAPDPFESSSSKAKNLSTSSISYNTQLFFSFADKKSIESRELEGEVYLINQEFPQATWKLTDETKTILGYKCRKAIKTEKAPEVSWTFRDKNNTQASRPSTVEVVAWYAEDIPVPAGPEIYNLLPGAVLEVNVDNEAVVYRATEISKSLKKNDLKEPNKGKLVSHDEFKQARSRILGGKKIKL